MSNKANYISYLKNNILLVNMMIMQLIEVTFFITNNVYFTSSTQYPPCKHVILLYRRASHRNAAECCELVPLLSSPFLINFLKTLSKYSFYCHF